VPRIATLQEIEQIVGAEHFRAEAGDCAAYEVDGVRPAGVARPGTQEQVAEIMRLCAAEGLAVIPCGARTALGIGAAATRYDLALDMTRINRIVAYEPADMTLGVEAGVRLAEVEKLLGEKEQFLPLDPPRAEEATVGGTLAANLSGPLRQGFGTARDLVLGVEFVTGEGLTSKSGGRVVKNVAGLDLHKLLIGSLGTLGVITAVNFRTFPRQRARETFVVTCGTREGALRLRAGIAASPLGLEAFEIMSPGAARLVDSEGRFLPAEGWTTVAAVTGLEPVLARSRQELERLAREARSEDVRALPGSDATELWKRMRDFPERARAVAAETAVFKCSVLPGQFDGLVASADRIAREQGLAAAVLLRAVGIAYVAMRPGAGAGNALPRLEAACHEVFAATTQAGGRAVIERCAVELKRNISVWGPPAPDWALMRRMKAVFDPKGILSPGRFVGGM
jgi:glycolate oxidase FAD binding subunit